MAGRVLVDDVPVDKAGTRVPLEAAIRLKKGTGRSGGDALDLVSRGGGKLAGALDDFGMDVTGLRCLDIGASTGGFTDCLLQRGAQSVVAIDVGRGQLHEKLRQDPRVTLLEKTNARTLEAGSLPEPVDLVVVDVSFISLRLLLAPLAAASGGAPILALVKPQFEVGKEHVGKGGVVNDDGLRAEAARAVAACGAALGYEVVGQADSRVAGPKGNREIFLRLARPDVAPASDPEGGG